MSLSAASQEAVWLTQLKSEIFGAYDETITIYCDNKAAVNLTENGTYSARTKHISIRHHFVRELASSGKINVQHINTDEMVTDIFTKALPSPKRNFCINKLGLSK